MALILNETNEVLTATGLSANWTDGVGAGTLLFWVNYSTSGSATYATPAGISAGTSRANETCILRDGNWKQQVAGSALKDTTKAPENGVWRGLGFAKSLDGTVKSVYHWDGSTLTEADFAITGGYNYARLTLGRTCDSGAGTQYNGKIAHVRLFDARLTDAEIQSEFGSATVVKTANCTNAWPLISDLNATTGAVNFTASSGTATFDADTPVSGASAVAAIAGRHYSRMRA